MASDVASTKSSEHVLDLLNLQANKRRDSRRESNTSFVTAPSAANTQATLRRRSTLKTCSQGLMGLMRLRRLTLAKKVPEEPKIRYENTYRLDPVKSDIFPEHRVKETAENALSNYLENETYNEAKCAVLACNIADIIKNRVKNMNIPRYRIVCQVIIGEVKNQGIEAASMSVWNEKTDNYACATFRNNTIVATAMVHGVYLD